MRLFLAIDPGQDCRRRIADFIENVQAHTSGIRWVRPDKLHITLAFLGEVDDAQVDTIVQGGHAMSTNHARFSVAVSESGVFPNWRRPRVIWLGIKDGGALAQLGHDVHAMCAKLGFSLDHPFRAHLTIGRATQPLSGHQRDVLKNALKTPTGQHPFAVTRVSLLRSTLGPGGSVYREVTSFPLGGA